MGNKLKLYIKNLHEFLDSGKIIDDPEDEENCTLKTIDDEELYERIGDAFIEQFGMYDEEDAGDSE